MPSTVIFNDFRAPKYFRNRFRRAEYEIRNANLHHGDVRPFACPELVTASVGNLQSLHPLPGCKDLGFLDGRHLVEGFCSDQYFHIEGGELVQSTEIDLCNEVSPCRAGSPFQPIAPSVSAGCSGCDATGVAYVITYVTEHAGIQVESAPSPASTIVATAGDVPNASVSWGTAPAGFCIVATRVYRVETTFEDGTDQMPAQGAEFVFVQEFAGSGANSFVDNLASHQTGGPLTTYEPMAFPAPNNLVDVARTADGVVVADDHRVYISQPGEPQFTFDGVVEITDQILAIRAIENTIFVFTDHWPVKIAYRHTDQIMSIDKQTVKRSLPLTSVRSISVRDNDIFFASTYSMYRWNTGARGSDIRSLWNTLLTTEQWKQIDPNSVRGVAYEYGYILSSDSIDYSLMVELGEDGTDTLGGTSIMPIDYVNPEAFAINYNGDIVYQQGGDIYCWDYRREQCSPYRVEDHVIPPRCAMCDCCAWVVTMYYDNEGKNNFPWMRVEWDERSANELTLNFVLKAFGESQSIPNPITILSSRGFRIPRQNSSQTFCLELTGCGIMHEIRMATSAQELVSNSNNQIENRQLEN